MNKPYPGTNPNYQVYNNIGGYKRECFIIELHCLDCLNSQEKNLIRERVEALISSMSNSLGIEKSQIVISDQFDTILRSALRME